MSVTTNSLIDNIKSRGLVPSTQNTITDSMIVNWCNEEQKLAIVPLILKYQEELLIQEVEIDVKVGQGTYDLPPRAFGGRVRDIVFRNGDGFLTTPVRINREDLANLQNQGDTMGFFLEGNRIRLVPTPQREFVMIVAVPLRPSNLVLESQARRITTVLEGSIAMMSLPAFILNGEPFDVVSDTYNEVISFAQVPVNVDVATGTVNANTDRLHAGDWVVRSGVTPIVQLPEEFISILAERVAMRILKTLGDGEAVSMAMATLKEMEKNLSLVVANRVASAPRKIVNRHSLLRNNRAMGKGVV